MAPMRSQRVSELLQQELADLLVHSLKDPRIGFVTVTEVRVANDLRVAKVFVSVYGSDEHARQSLEGLNAATGFLRRELGRRVPLKFMPTLVFCRDDTLERAERLDTLIQAIAKGETEAPDEQVTQTLPVETSRSSLAERAKEFPMKAEKPPRRRVRSSGSARNRR